MPTSPFAQQAPEAQASTRQRRAGLGVRLFVWAALTALVLALARLAWTHNLERACTLAQWPVLPSCAAAAAAAADAPAQAQRLRERIARNPGDSEAWIALAVLTSQAGQTPGFNPGLDHDRVLETATQLAGQDYRVQRMQAARAVQRQLWPQAVDWLTRLVQDSGDGPAAAALAGMLRQPQALAAMQAQLKPGARWLGPVIDAMPQAGLPVVGSMTLVASALAQQDLPPELARQLLRQLQADGQWLEAHALWTASLGHAVPLLFNGDFEQGFTDSGFDWVVTPVPPSRAGALASQVALQGHGGVLQVDFTGRPVALPVVRQHLVLLHPRYALSAQFMAARLGVNEGLAWTLHCVLDGREIARTPALKDTAGRWQAFSVEFEVPPGCGQAVALQLQTFAPDEALAGLQGQAAFDNFKLQARP